MFGHGVTHARITPAHSTFRFDDVSHPGYGVYIIYGLTNTVTHGSESVSHLATSCRVQVGTHWGWWCTEVDKQPRHLEPVYNNSNTWF